MQCKDLKRGKSITVPQGYSFEVGSRGPFRLALLGPDRFDLRLGLKAYWNFDEGFGSRVTDRSGQGNDARLMNAPKWTKGKRGMALRLDILRGAFSIVLDDEG